MAKAKQLPSGNWRIQPHKTVNGKYIRTSITAQTKKEAERLAANWEVEQEEEKKKASKETLRDVLKKYIETCKSQGSSPSTIKGYTSQLKVSFVDILDIDINDLTTQDIQAQLDKRSKTVSPKTLSNDIAFIRAALSSRDHNINFRKLKIAKKKKRKKMALKLAWKTKIPELLAKWYGKDDYYLYVILLIYAGLRPSESYSLTWGDLSKSPKEVDGAKLGYINISKATVKSEENVFTEKETKSESGMRSVVVSWSLIEEICTTKPRKKDDEKIIELSPYDETEKWERLKAELNLPDAMRRYDLRHYYATSLVISGATDEELQDQMGHSSSSFSHNFYVEIMEEHKTTVTTKYAVESMASIESLKKLSANSSGE